MRKQFKFPIWILPVPIAGLVALLGWWGNGCLRATIEGELKARLTATLNANVTALGIWSTNQTRLATALTEDPSVQTLAAAVLQAPPPASPPKGRMMQIIPSDFTFAHRDDEA